MDNKPSFIKFLLKYGVYILIIVFVSYANQAPGGFLVALGTILTTLCYIFSFLIDKFWPILLLIFVVYKRHDFLDLIRTIYFCFFRNYNDSYPAFQKFEIGSLKADTMKLGDLQSRLDNRFYKRWGKHRDHFKKNKDLDEEAKQLIKTALEAGYKSEWSEKKADFMIEANNAVRNGKETIKSVQKEYSDKFSGKPHYWDLQKIYSEWELE